jgi:hypothetical protein
MEGHRDVARSAVGRDPPAEELPDGEERPLLAALEFRRDFEVSAA